ncbi:exoribonuclease 2 [Myxozyma melibiosi]|uniref:5'-3' exoribonuclease n=1 Tax=Myxozyma melibiosi TaxID=54550 RepID=A0ABR1F7I3_9ASCO
MGVPALFRWLSRKYPKIVQKVVEEPDQVIDGVTYPADYSRPNPNGETDNLYLDMNGIVHPCSHPENRPPPATEDEMFLEIFKYTDRVVNMARPRKVLMIAVDGVAPRAKMNQQRSRRFKSAREAHLKDMQKELVQEQMEAMGQVIDESIKKKTWDTNVITPGTPFMDKLAEAIRYWVAFKLNNEPGWKDLKVIISDASVPGEGEHKIMEFIRSQRQSPFHDPNTSHVIYGLDADLIMLGLATHEPHFRVLREDVFNNSQPNQCSRCGQVGHFVAQCKNSAIEIDPNVPEPKKPFIWLSVSVLREYLAMDLVVRPLPFKWDLERAIDDWVFMIFFVGNDFLPHIPSLEIRENGIDKLIRVWKMHLAVMGGYLTTDGSVNLKSTELLLKVHAQEEASIFAKRHDSEMRRQAGRNGQRNNNNNNNNNYNNNNNNNNNSGNNSSASTPKDATPVVKRNQVDIGPKALPTDIPLFTPQGGAPGTTKTITPMAAPGLATFSANAANKSAASFLKAQLLAKKSAPADEPETSASVVTDETETVATSVDGESSPSLKRKSNDGDEDEETESAVADKKIKIDDEGDVEDDDTPLDDTEVLEDGDGIDLTGDGDDVRLWEPGYHYRYYALKLHAKTKEEQEKVAREMVRSYVEGVSWVLLYYYQGCPSWTWYYPYHYAPFASDFVGIGELEIKFDMGKPFRPYEQLMGVMPSASAHTLPPILRELMTSEDSEIIDFYPENFAQDMNGQAVEWKSIALLPFIDEQRLLKAINSRYPLLTGEEQERNTYGNQALFISDSSWLGKALAEKLYPDGKPAETEEEQKKEVRIHPKQSRGLIGQVKPEPKYEPYGFVRCPVDKSPENFVSKWLGGEIKKYVDIQRNRAIAVIYQMPPKHEAAHKSMLLPGFVAEAKVVDEGEFFAARSSYNRNGPGGRGGYGNSGGNNFHNNNGGNHNYNHHNNSSGYNNNRSNYNNNNYNNNNSNYNNNNYNNYNNNNYNNNGKNYGGGHGGGNSYRGGRGR